MDHKLDFSVLLRGDYPKWILDGVITMFELTLAAWLLAMVLGTILAVARMSNIRAAKIAVAIYVEYHQNVPMLVQVFLWYFGIPALLPLPWQQWINAHDSALVLASIAGGLCMAAYVSEGLRGGIRAIPKSQLEAARAIGLSYLQAARLVVIPQALRIALPTLVSYTVLLFKNTSVAMTIGVAELTYATREIESQSFRTVEIYLLSTVIYLGFSLVILKAGTFLEGRYRIRAR